MVWNVPRQDCYPDSYRSVTGSHEVTVERWDGNTFAMARRQPALSRKNLQGARARGTEAFVAAVTLLPDASLSVTPAIVAEGAVMIQTERILGLRVQNLVENPEA